MPLLLFVLLLTISLSTADVEVASFIGTQGPARCAHTCAGTSLVTQDNWQEDSGSKYHWLQVIVDMSDCGFVSIPMVTCSLEGDELTTFALGGSSPINVTVNKFYVSLTGFTEPYGFDTNEYPTLKIARSWNWKINWSAVGYTC